MSPRIQLTMLSTIEPQNAPQKPATVRPDPISVLSHAISISKRAFKTSAKMPSVRMKSGNERNRNTVPSVPLTTPKTIATQKTVMAKGNGAIPGG